MNSSWLANNWGWLVVAAVVVIIIVAVSRKGKSSSSSYRSSGGSGGLNLNSEERAALNALVDALEGIVDQVLGSTYSSADKRKIAIGMVAVMATENVKLESLANDTQLFAEVMLKSITNLTKSGEIHTR